MKVFLKASDVLNALGAWEDSHDTGNNPEARAEAKEYAADALARYVWMQIFLFTTGVIVLEHILRWVFP